MVDPAVLTALVLDAVVGWPAPLHARLGHPVGVIARMIDRLEMRWNRADAAPFRRRIAGATTLIIVVTVTAAVAWACGLAAGQLLGRWQWLGIAALAWPGLAQRSLDDHVRPVAHALAAGDLPAARQSVAMIVGRDTGSLDEEGVARAAIESLAESFCDGVVAPLCWLMLLGLPGLWGYKAINTADSLIGHREERWRAFGWAAARTDDVANLIPARLAAVVIGVAGGGRGLGRVPREARKHASPNAGWPEAAMAGVLGLRLAGPVAYDGIVHDKPWIGTGRAAATSADVRRALSVYRCACLILWVVVGMIAWAR